MTPAEIRQIARQEAQRAVSNAPGVSLPSVWTNEVQIYNECLTSQGVRTLRGLAGIVCNLQSGGGGGSGLGPPCANERRFDFSVDQEVTVEHGSNLGAPEEEVVRTTVVTFFPDGRVSEVLDTWDQDGTTYGRTTTFNYSIGDGQLSGVICSVPAPYVPDLG